MREVVAKRIMEMAQRGVQDREALVADALRFIRPPSCTHVTLCDVRAEPFRQLRPTPPARDVAARTAELAAFNSLN